MLSPSAPSSTPLATIAFIWESWSALGALDDAPSTLPRTEPKPTKSAALVPIPFFSQRVKVSATSTGPPPSFPVMTVVTPCMR